MEVTLCDFWSYILNGYATTTWFYCDTCSGGSQIPCKKSNSPEDHTLKRPHIGALADSSRWVQPSIIPAAVPDMWVKSSWALQTGPSAGYVQLNIIYVSIHIHTHTQDWTPLSSFTDKLRLREVTWSSVMQLIAEVGFKFKQSDFRNLALTISINDSSLSSFSTISFSFPYYY